MECLNREGMEQRFVELLAGADSIGFLMMVAILCSIVRNSGTDIVDGYTKGDFKRVIKRLRMVQKYAPQYAADYEAAIAHIRKEWLHKEVAA